MLRTEKPRGEADFYGLLRALIMVPLTRALWKDSFVVFFYLCLWGAQFLFAGSSRKPALVHFFSSSFNDRHILSYLNSANISSRIAFNGFLVFFFFFFHNKSRFLSPPFEAIFPLGPSEYTPCGSNTWTKLFLYVLGV